MAADESQPGNPSGPAIRQSSDGGLSGSHADTVLSDIPVATATTTEKNTIVRPLRAVGCWSMGDTRFAFDSSFLDPSAAEDFPLLASVREAHKETIQDQDVYPPVSVFGHADPVGQDDYNKELSGRRARAVYAALVRDTAAWEQLYSQPYQGDNWGSRSIQLMLAEVGEDSGNSSGSPDADTQSAVRAFQQSEGLPVDGSAGPQTRAKLFEKYMDRLCGPDLKLSKTDDFLARGADSGGKGDYQGCGEFNPVLMFSAAENETLNQPEQKGDRDAQNAPNRRVLALLFSPGEQVTPAKWPCPRATEGTAGCRKRFWSDAASRRSFQAQRRLYEITRDTFACRFYDLLADQSPCERAAAVLRIRLHDPLGHKMPAVEYQLEYGGRTKSGRAEKDGFLSEVLSPGTENCVVRWEPAAADSSTSDSDSNSTQSFLHELTVFIVLQDLESEEGLKRRLHNLGYPIDGDSETNLRSFQAHHGLEITGEADAATKEKLRSIYGDSLDQAIDPEDTPAPSAPDSEQRT